MLSTRPQLPTGLGSIPDQLIYLTFPLFLTDVCVIFFGTLDSAEMGKVALLTWGVCTLFITVGFTTPFFMDGQYAHAVQCLVGSCIIWSAGFGWLFWTIRARLRMRFQGGLAPRAYHYTARLLQIAGLQIALLVQGVALGLGPESAPRNYAINSVSESLVIAWVFSIGVFDAGETDPKKVALLQLSLTESVTMVGTAVYVLAGLAGYVIAEQPNPDGSTTSAQYLDFVNLYTMLFVALLVGRILYIARKKDAVGRASTTTTAMTTAAASHAGCSAGSVGMV